MAEGIRRFADADALRADHTHAVRTDASVFGCVCYERLAKIANDHLFNVHQSRAYRLRRCGIDRSTARVRITETGGRVLSNGSHTPTFRGPTFMTRKGFRRSRGEQVSL